MRLRAVWVVLFLPCIAYAANIEHTRHLELSTEDIQSMHIMCGPGFLDVFGVERADRIKVTAAVRISGITQDRLPDFLDKHVLLSLKRRNRMAVLQSEFVDQNRMQADARIDLTVEVPKTLALKIEDESGSIFIADLETSLEIEDGSGLIEIRMIRGNVSIGDDSGKIRLTDIIGNLEIRDGSGEIFIDRVRGDVRITDGSGGMTLTDIDGNLTITDGSGSIEITDVTQNVFIKEAGSGSLEIEGVKGKVITRE